MNINHIEMLLSAFVPFFICVLMITLLLFLLSYFLRYKKSKSFKYQQRPGLFTNNELAFYKALLPVATKKGYTVFGKVRIADLLEPKKGSPNWRAAFNKICAKHVDFVLCNRTSLKPVLVIELDDKTHDRKDRQQRDQFVDHAMHTAGLPIIHTRSSDNLDKQIDQIIGKRA